LLGVVRKPPGKEEVGDETSRQESTRPVATRTRTSTPALGALEPEGERGQGWKVDEITAQRHGVLLFVSA